jgi:hypothetical protein
MVTESESPLSRSALLAGSSGLIGRALLPLLLASPRYAQVHALLRRPVPELRADRKLQLQVVDFQALPDLPQVDDVFIALGTTIKVAGSRSAFRQVDFDAVLNTARAARTAGATRLAVVSALGADARSRVFYNRVKGEMQDAVAALGFGSVVIVQPSFLLGDRSALGQPVRAPPRQNSCRLHRTTPGAAMKEDSGSIRTGIQRQGGSEIAATRERSAGGGGAGSWHWSGNPGALARGCAVQARPRAGLDCRRPA